jgi:Fe2+ or Zn2+ uptake regulation protein
MVQMDFDEIIRALFLKTRREIPRSIINRPKTFMQIYGGLKERKIQIKYRESVYNALEKLVSVGLVEKVYKKKNSLLQIKVF